MSRPEEGERADMTDPVPDHASDRVEILPVADLPEFRPGDDLTAAIATAAPWLRTGDVLVVTSKIVSKTEGRLVSVPGDPGAREAARRNAVRSEAVRVVARYRDFMITENRLGIVQAASGVDGSNVSTGEIALLPIDPDASARRLRDGLRETLGVEVAVIITDTMGRAWRIGQTDAAIGAAGLTVLHRYAGAIDRQGNELAVTEMALADEIAAAADLVKGKLGGVPVAVLRGLAVHDDGSTARDMAKKLTAGNSAIHGPRRRSDWSGLGSRLTTTSRAASSCDSSAGIESGVGSAAATSAPLWARNVASSCRLAASASTTMQLTRSSMSCLRCPRWSHYSCGS